MPMSQMSRQCTSQPVRKMASLVSAPAEGPVASLVSAPAEGPVATPTVLDTVLEAHRAQFEAMRLPETLWARAVQKLAGQVLDAGTALGFALDEEAVAGGPQKAHLRYDVVARGDLKAEEDCWLSGHIWAFPDEAFALKALSEDAAAAQRVAQLMEREDVFEMQADADQDDDARAITTNAAIGNKLIDELQRYAYPLFDAAGTRYPSQRTTAPP